MEARKNKVKINWDEYVPKRPSFLGIRSLTNFPLEEIRPYVDWTPFFQTWMLAGRYPGILQDKIVGSEARKLFDDAQKTLDQIVKEKSLHANGVFGFFPAVSTDSDDVLLFKDESQNESFTTFHFLRQQNKKAQNLPNFCLADFVAPQSLGKKDYIGMFAVTAGMGIEKLVERCKANHDDYGEIMVKALADRLAEAFAECLHAKVRKEFWGYAEDEQLTANELIEEKYKGIRPAPGYPACPDHTEKQVLFEIMEAGKGAGIVLTESFAMYPASSVSGYYFAHPEARYFGLGKIEKDQVNEYALRKAMSVEEIERWLSPNLAYEP